MIIFVFSLYVFLLGGLGLYYSQLLKELPRDFCLGQTVNSIGLAATHSSW